MDFARDTCGEGRAFRALTIVDDCTRECPAIEVDGSLPGERVVLVLERLAHTPGLPRAIVCDNEPEVAGTALDAWAFTRGVMLDFIDPRKPTQNAFIESLHRTLRQECLNENWFVSLADTQHRIETWRLEYNTERPHSRLRNRTPGNLRRTSPDRQLPTSTPLADITTGPEWGVTSPSHANASN